MMKQVLICALTGLFALTGCASTEADTEAAAAATPSIEVGNGENNYIILDNVSRDGAQFVFETVAIDQPGWLVMHPFENGAPAQTVYVGARLLGAGTHKDVAITIDEAPQSGDMFVIMLHYDVNKDGIFDFNDGVTVPDAPVFEGNRLIALRFAAP